MLHQLEIEGLTEVASFLPHSRAFMVWDKETFVKEVMPRFFGTMKRWSSFTRQLQLYGFLRVADGVDEGAYYHILFLRGRLELCRYMMRVGTPTQGGDRRRRAYKEVSKEGADPNFYALPLVLP